MRNDGFFFFFSTCQNPCGICQCMIIGAFDTSKGIKTGLDPMNYWFSIKKWESGFNKFISIHKKNMMILSYMVCMKQ
jgi:hypothetical protein